MKHRAYIHIGLHKTGTTSIQRWLTANPRTLDDHGLYYPSAGQEDRPLLQPRSTKPTVLSHKFLATNQVKRTPLADLNNWRSLAHEVKGIDRDIILSSEKFTKVFARKAKITEVQDFLEDLGYETVFVVFLRDFAGYANSRFVQEVKRFLYEGSFEDFLIKKSALFDFDRILRPFWKTADIRVVGFERNRPVLSQFFDALGLPSLSTNLSNADLNQRSNTSVGPLTVLAAQRIIKRCGSLPKMAKTPEAGAARKRLREEADKRNWNDRGYCGFDEQSAQVFRRMYAPKTTKLVKRLSVADWFEFAPPEKMELNVIKPEQVTGEMEAELSEVEQAVLKVLRYGAPTSSKWKGLFRRLAE